MKVYNKYNERLPNFIIAGAKKSGTTTIFEVLKNHPDVYLPKCKEIHFFDRTESYRKGLENYRKFFKNVRNEKIIMDITPNYMYKSYVPERLSKTLPNVILIFVLRNPIKRAYSNYWDNVRDQTEKLPFSEAVKQNSVYVEKSLYYKHISNFLNYFDKKNISIFLSEQLFKHPDIFYDNLCSLLRIKFEKLKDINVVRNYARVPKWRSLHKVFISQSPLLKKLRKVLPSYAKNVLKLISENVNMNRIQYPDIDQKTREYLIELFRDDILNLSKLFDLDIDYWLD